MAAHNEETPRRSAEGHVSGDQYRDESDLKRYRTEIPNMIFDLGLSPYEVALYGHFKRVCGAEPGGVCWKSVRALSKETRMSIGRVSEARAELARRGLIRMSQPKGPGRSVTVTIVDIWPENMARYSADRDRSYYEHPVHSMNASRSPHERKKEPYEEEPFKNYSEVSKNKGKPRSNSARRREGYEWLFE